MQTVSFTRMADGTAAEYQFLEQLEQDYALALPERLMAALKQLEHSFSGYQINRLEHALQGATRAYRDGRDDEYIAAVLLHDIGDELAPYAHSELAAAVLRPYVSERLYWIVKYHGVFQMWYYAHHLGSDRHARERFKDHPWYQDAIEFCELYDQNCFDPDYDTLPLEFFQPLLQRIFGCKPKFGGERD